MDKAATKSVDDHVSAMEHENVDVEYVKQQGYMGDHVTKQGRISPVERTLFWKAACLIGALAALMYFVAYLDRNSIGNARVAGMLKDLELSEKQYSLCVSMFFVGYVLFMLPGNIVLRWIPPNFVIGGCAIIFGALVCGLGGAKNYATVLGIRILIGFSQAFIQGLTVYTPLWFKRDEVASIAATFYSAASISGAFSGLIAYGALKTLGEEKTGLASWRWVYIIDGVIAMFAGTLVVLLLPRFPDKMKKSKHWLFTAEELQIARERVASFNTMGAKIEVRQMWAAVKDPKTWAFFVMQMGVATGLGTIGAYLPAFIHSFGFSPLRTQLFSVLPSASAFCALLIICYTSDYFNKKGIFLVGTLSTVIIGYIILLTDVSVPVKVFATCLVTGCLYPSVILLTSWLSVNTCGFTKRGTTWAMAEVSGQCFSIMGSHVYTDPPRFIQGHSIILALQCLALLATIALIFWLRHCNMKKDRIDAEYRERGEIHPDNEKSLEELYDQHQNFRYIL